MELKTAIYNFLDHHFDDLRSHDAAQEIDNRNWKYWRSEERYSWVCYDNHHNKIIVSSYFEIFFFFISNEESHMHFERYFFDLVKKRDGRVNINTVIEILH